MEILGFCQFVCVCGWVGWLDKWVSVCLCVCVCTRVFFVLSFCVWCLCSVKEHVFLFVQMQFALSEQMSEIESVSYALLSMLSMLAILILITRWYRKFRLRHYEVPVYDFHKGHRFYMVDMFTTPTYCNVGHVHIIHGAQCDSCGICVDDHAMKEANIRSDLTEWFAFLCLSHNQLPMCKLNQNRPELYFHMKSHGKVRGFWHKAIQDFSLQTVCKKKMFMAFCVALLMRQREKLMKELQTLVLDETWKILEFCELVIWQTLSQTYYKA